MRRVRRVGEDPEPQPKGERQTLGRWPLVDRAQAHLLRRAGCFGGVF